MSENNNKPLWLPQGSVRSIIALAFVAVVIVAVLKVMEVPQPLWDLTLVIVGFYFGTKAVSK